MPAKVGQLELDFLLNLAQFQTDLNKSVTATEKAATQMQKTMGNAMKGIAASVATIGVGVVFQQLTKNIDEAESSIAQVNASIRSTGGVAGVTAKQVEDLAQSMKKLNGVDDDAVRSMASVLLTFTKVGKETFPQATQAIVDMSAKLGTDLKASAIQVGKALNDPIKGVSALQRVGVSFTESQKALIKSLVDSGKTMEAQKLILRELETEFGGAAAAARDTLGGALKALDISVGDVWQSIGGGAGGGLRLAVEMLNIGMEKTAATITDMQNPASALGKTFGSMSKDFESATLSAMVWTSAAVYGIKAVSYEAEKFTKNNKDLFEMFGSVANAALPPEMKLIKQAFEGLGFAVQKTDKDFKQLSELGLLPNVFQPVIDSVSEAQKRIDDLHKSAAKFKGPGAGGEDVEVKSKKEIDALAKQRKAMDDILRAYEQKNEAVGKQTIEQKAQLEMLEAERKISNLTNVPLRERLNAINEIAAATRERIKLENDSKIAEQAVTLKDMLADMQKEVLLGQNKKDDQEELNTLVEAEAKVREMTKGYAGENLELQNQILDVARKQVEAAQAMKHDAALKTVKEITKQYDEEYQSLLDQIAGTENLNKLRKETERINATKGLSDDEKNAAIGHITDLDSKTRALNKTYKDSESLVDNIAASEANHTEKVKALQQAYADKQLNERQFADGLNKIASSSDKAKNAASSFVGILSSGFNNIFQGGQKVTDVFKQMGKSLLELTAKTLLFGPLERALTGFADRFLGGSSKQSAVANLPPGVVQDPNGKYSYDPTGSNSSYWPSNLPNKATGATGAAQTGMLGGALGGAAGLGGLLSTGGGALGGLLGLLGGKSSSAINPAAAAPAGFMNTLKQLISSGGHVIDPKKPLDNNQLFDAWEYRQKQGGSKEVDGKGLEDFEYYKNKIDRLEAGKRLGAVNSKEAGFSDIFKLLTGGQGLGDMLKQTKGGILSPIMGGAVGASGVLTSSSANSLKQVEKTVNTGVTGMFNSLTGSLKSGFSALTAPVTSTIKNLFTGSTVSGLFSSITSSIGSLLGGLTSSIKGGLSSLLSPITSSIGKLFGGGGSGGGGSLLSGLGSAFGSVGSSLGGSFKSWFGGGSSGGSLFSGLGKAAGSLGSSLMGSLGSWFGGGGSSGGDPNGYMMQGFGGFGSLDQYAAGGWAGSGEPFVAGENGREIIWPGAQAAYVMNNQQTERMLGGGNGALSQITGWMNDLQSGRAGGTGGGGGQSMGYWEAQEYRQKIRDAYSSGMGWNDGKQLELALYSDSVEKIRAQKWLQNPTTYNGVVNDNERARMELRAVYGTGAEAAVRAGGRSGWGGGNQQLNFLDQAEADTGIRASNSLRDTAAFDANVWNANEGIFGPMSDLSPLALRKIAGNLSYNSMGVGAGQGNTNYGAVYGGDFMDARTGANGSERMDAMGGKDFMWQKFHGFRGAGYENISDMWSRFHTSNLSFGGGNFIGDKDFEQRMINRPYGGTTGQRRRSAQGTTDYYDTPSIPYGPGQRRAWVDESEYGKYTLAGDIAVPHYDSRQYPFPPRASVPTRQETWNEQQSAIDYYKKLTGGTSNPELGTISAFKQYARKFFADSNSAFTGDRASKSAQSSGPVEGLHRNSWAARRNTQAYNNQRMGEYLSQIMQPLDGSGLRRIESHMNGVGYGGAVGAPGKLTTSYGDVFDQQTTIRARNPYYNMADGFDSGYFAARNGSDVGATKPRGGWAYGGPRAQGGHVDKNLMYKVLEHGDEAFIPDTAGRIMPMNKLMGGSAPNIQINDRVGVNIKTQRSANGRDTTFEITSMVAQDNVNGAGAKTLAAVYGLERQPTRRG